MNRIQRFGFYNYGNCCEKFEFLQQDNELPRAAEDCRVSTPTVAADNAADFITVRQTAEAFPALGRRFVERRRDTRKIPICKIAGNHAVMRRSDIAAYIESGRIDPTA